VKNILLAMLFIGNSLFANANYADSGSEIETQYMMKLSLIKEDNSKVEILDGTKYLKLQSDANVSGIGASLEAVRPSDGTYIGVEYSVPKFKKKIKLISANTTYYSKEFEKNSNDPYALSQNEQDYGYTTTILPTNSTRLLFPKSLILKKGTDSSLFFTNQFTPNKVIYETMGTIENSSTIRSEELLSVFLPSLPKKKVTININYTKTNENNLTNTVILFLDSEDDLIGGFLARPLSNIALGGNDLLEGNKNSNDYTLKFKNADDSADDNDYFSISGTFDCTNSTYSSLVISEVKDGGTPSTAKPQNQDGYSLIESGNITCTDINITE
jgi:hypothetical protein